jgi:hypothetical protein
MNGGSAALLSSCVRGEEESNSESIEEAQEDVVLHENPVESIVEVVCSDDVVVDCGRGLSSIFSGVIWIGIGC